MLMEVGLCIVSDSWFQSLIASDRNYDLVHINKYLKFLMSFNPPCLTHTYLVSFHLVCAGQ